MRTLKVIDADIRQVRARIQDSVRGTAKWKTAWEYMDRLLDERAQAVSAEKAKSK
jgi:hypothetical protein